MTGIARRLPDEYVVLLSKDLNGQLPSPQETAELLEDMR